MRLDTASSFNTSIDAAANTSPVSVPIKRALTLNVFTRSETEPKTIESTPRTRPNFCADAGSTIPSSSTSARDYLVELLSLDNFELFGQVKASDEFFGEKRPKFVTLP